MSDTTEKFEAWWQNYFSKMNANAFKGHKDVAEHTWMHATAEQNKAIAELNARIAELAEALEDALPALIVASDHYYYLNGSESHLAHKYNELNVKFCGLIAKAKQVKE